MHLLRRFYFALFILFNHGIDDIGLMSGGDLLADEFPNFWRAQITEYSEAEVATAAFEIMKQNGGYLE